MAEERLEGLEEFERFEEFEELEKAEGLKGSMVEWLKRDIVAYAISERNP